MPTTDAISLLKADHKNVRGLFAALDDLGERAFVQRAKIAGQICSELEVHAKAEEQILYPAFQARAQANTDERDQVLEAEEEHKLLDGLVAQTKHLDAKDETFNPKLKVIEDLFEHHVKEEERTFFPMCRELFEAEELRRMGEQIVEFKAAQRAERR